MRGTTNKKDWRKTPKMRINKAKGHSYVQVRNVFGKWVTMGELTPDSFAMAWALVDNIERGFLQKRVHGMLEKHKLDHLKKEFDDILRDATNGMEYKISTQSPWNPAEDGPNREETIFRKANQKEEKATSEMMKKDAEKHKKAMRKLGKVLKLPEPEKEEEKEEKKDE